MPIHSKSPISLADFVLGEHLADGGMAQIFRAHPTEDRYDCHVVAKCLLPKYAHQAEFRDMFAHEAAIASELVHPNIATVLDHNTDADRPFMIMEFVDGPDLLTVLQRCELLGQRIPTAVAIHIACQVLDALAYGHRGANAIVHRDISPSNILIGRDGSVKLTDFGIAYRGDDASRTTALQGKFCYMSPEQARRRPLDLRSDIFSLTTVLAEMLIQKRLFSCRSDADTLLMVRHADTSRLTRSEHTPPKRLLAMIERGLSRDPQDRFRCALELREALTEWRMERRMPCGAEALADLVATLQTRTGSLFRAQATGAAQGQSRDTVTRAGTDEPVTYTSYSTSYGTLPVLEPRLESELDYLLPDADLLPHLPQAHAARDDAQLDRPNEFHDDEGVDITQGSIGDTRVIDILSRIRARRLSGILVLKSDDLVKQAYFENGDPQSVHSNIERDRFGTFLVRKGVLTSSRLRATLDHLQYFQGSLGELLVHLEILQPSKMVTLLAAQVADKLVDACRWDHGQYFFIEGIKAPEPKADLHLQGTEIIGRCLDSVPPDRLLSWAKRFRNTAPTVDIETALTLRLDSDVQRCIEWVAEGSCSLGEVVMRNPANARPVLAAAYILWRLSSLRSASGHRASSAWR